MTCPQYIALFLIALVLACFAGWFITLCISSMGTTEVTELEKAASQSRKFPHTY